MHSSGSGKASKLAVEVALQSPMIDAEIVNIILAIKDRQFVISRLAGAMADGKSVEPQAQEIIMSQDEAFREKLASALLAEYEEITQRHGITGKAKFLHSFAANLKGDAVADADKQIASALMAGDTLQTARIIAKARKINTMQLQRQAQEEPELACRLAQDMRTLVKANGISQGKAQFITILAQNLETAAQDNQRFAGIIEGGDPEKIANAVCDFKYITPKNILALEAFAASHADDAVDLIRWIREDRDQLREDGKPGRAAFLHNLANCLEQAVGESES